MSPQTTHPGDGSEHYTTFEVSRLLGLAVRSVQLMVDREELEAWKTTGGHRRITRESVLRWLDAHPRHSKGTLVGRQAGAGDARSGTPPRGKSPRALLIEDSVHYQNLIRLLMQEHFPDVELHVANDGFSGLARYGALSPNVLLVDMMLPGMDGATLIGALRTQPTFRGVELIVVTSLTPKDIEQYSYVLQGVTVVHKTELIHRLPQELARALAREFEEAGAT